MTATYPSVVAFSQYTVTGCHAANGYADDVAVTVLSPCKKKQLVVHISVYACLATITALLAVTELTDHDVGFASHLRERN
jgi:hypothetical protein